MAIYMAIFMGGTPIGAPIVGWVADAFGPRWALVVGGASGILAAAVGVYYMVRYRGMRLAISERRLRFTFTEPSRGLAIAEMEGDEAAAQRA
jgi:MFS family permease